AEGLGPQGQAERARVGEHVPRVRDQRQAARQEAGHDLDDEERGGQQQRPADPPARARRRVGVPLRAVLVVMVAAHFAPFLRRAPLKRPPSTADGTRLPMLHERASSLWLLPLALLLGCSFGGSQHGSAGTGGKGGGTASGAGGGGGAASGGGGTTGS